MFSSRQAAESKVLRQRRLQKLLSCCSSAGCGFESHLQLKALEFEKAFQLMFHDVAANLVTALASQLEFWKIKLLELSAWKIKLLELSGRSNGWNHLENH